MGIKISSLPVNALPYTGSEKIPLVQGGETRAGTLSSFVNYLSAGSANYAVKNADNNFTTGQTIQGSITASEFVFTGNTDPPGRTYSLKLNNNSGDLLTLTDNTSNPSATNSIIIGRRAGFDLGADGGDVVDAICIGRGAGEDMGYDGGGGESVIAIGKNSCNGSGRTTGGIQNIVAIGEESNSQAGTEDGACINAISIGHYAGYYGGGFGGFVSDIISIGQESNFRLGYEGGSAANVISIGNRAGYMDSDVYGTPSNNNIFIGLSSGHNKEGSRNTFIGDLTNTVPSFASISGCIAIGYGARPSARNTIAIGSAATPLSVVPGQSITNSLSGLKIMINGTYYTIPLLA
jgi:hypothetical protein